MANTLIQIKRSTTTSAPTTLSIGELAYSYQSNTLFIGNTTGDGVIVVGGPSVGSDVANAYARVFANSVGSAGNTYAEAIGTAGNAYAVSVGTSGNAYAVAVGTAGNTYADAVGTAGNNYTSATYVKLSSATPQTVDSDLNLNGNLTVTGTTTFVNTQSLLVSDNIFVLNSDLDIGTAATQDAGMQVNRGSDANVYVLWNETSNKWTFTNDGTTYQNLVGNTDLETVATSANGYATSVGSSGNTYAEAVGTAGNAYAVSVGTAGNAYAVSVGTSGNTYAEAIGTAGNAYAVSVGTAGNAYAVSIGTAGNTNAANGSYISTGNVAVAYGGTGNTSLTNNGVLVGRGTDPVSTLYSSTEGNVLQINDLGVPIFGFLDGGSF